MLVIIFFELIDLHNDALCCTQASELQQIIQGFFFKDMCPNSLSYEADQTGFEVVLMVLTTKLCSANEVFL